MLVAHLRYGTEAHHTKASDSGDTMGRLDEKVALITGGRAHGTGAAIAQMFADEGARVVIADLLDDRGKQTAEKIGDAARFRHHDVTSEHDWSEAVDELPRRRAHSTCS